MRKDRKDTGDASRASKTERDLEQPNFFELMDDELAPIAAALNMSVPEYKDFMRNKSEENGGFGTGTDINAGRHTTKTSPYSGTVFNTEKWGLGWNKDLHPGKRKKRNG